MHRYVLFLDMPNRYYRSLRVGGAILLTVPALTIMEPTILNALGIGAILTSIVGLVAWLVRDTRGQAVNVNKQFLDHMQAALQKEQSIHATYADSINKLAAAVEANTATLTPLIGSVKEMSESMKQMSESVKRMVEDHHRDIENLVADWRKANRSGSIDERI